MLTIYHAYKYLTLLHRDNTILSYMYVYHILSNCIHLSSQLDHHNLGRIWHSNLLTYPKKPCLLCSNYNLEQLKHRFNSHGQVLSIVYSRIFNIKCRYNFLILQQIILLNIWGLSNPYSLLS